MASLRPDLDRLKAAVGTRPAGPPPADFAAWLRLASPQWDWAVPHLALVRRQLAKVTAGECRRLILSVPPRHGKSEQVTIRYPVYRLDHDPAFRVCVGCYAQQFANRFGRKSRRVARGRLALSAERSAACEWETAAGGVYRSCGVGSPPMGEGFDLIVVDDPVKSREEAESEAYRERVWDWFSQDLFSRLEPGGAAVVIATRWHSDDLPGRLLAAEDAAEWTVVNLPAEAEDDDPLGRAPGEALWPERYDRAELRSRRRMLGEYAYGALYQGRPAPREGGMFQRAWFRQVVAAVPPGCSFVRYWDKAGTAGGTGAATAGVLMARDGAGLFYVAGVEWGRWAATERERIIRETAEADRERYGHVRIYVEQEPGSGGKESAEATVRNLAGFTVQADRPSGDKTVRAEPFAAQAGANNVRLVRGEWNRAYVDELASFPAGKLRDRVDASSGAFNKLAVEPDWDEFARRVQRSARQGRTDRQLITGAMPKF